MNEEEYFKLKEDCRGIGDWLERFITAHKNDDKILYVIKGCVDELKRNHFTLDVEKLQVISNILQSKNSSEIQEIISYFDHLDYGWQGDEYKFYSRCSWKCRKNYRIDNTPEMTEQAFSSMDEIFLHKEYGAITTYLFGYCVASLFSSKLKEKHCGIPYFLQIACKRNSNVYRLVHEIVRICDINTGLFEACEKYEYRECDHDHLTLYPSGTGDSLLEELLYYRDIPIIVDGYENEKLYEMLIREVANMPGRIKRLDINARFNILPVFISPMIGSRFHNIVSIDLTEMDIADEYLDIILENKQCLGSWALELVQEAKEYFNAGNSTSYSHKTAAAKIIELRKPEKQTPLFHDLTGYINRLRTKYNRAIKLTSKDIDNIGYLSYFLSYYMKVFKRSIQLTQETSFTYRGIDDKHIPEKLVEQIVEQATDSLFQLHGVCSPALPDILNMEIDDSGKINAKKIEKKGAGYAKDIVKYYQSYKVSIRISNVKYNEERYIFYIKPLPGTDTKLLRRYADEVRRFIEVEFFALDITPSEIKLVVSEKPLHENSLIKILESTKFKESEMDIPYAVGYDLMGEAVIADISDFPHLLIGGATDSGKSSAVHSLLMSIVYKQPADKVKLLLMDFGASRLKIFKDVPHMLTPGKIISDIREGRQCILKLQEFMEKREKILDSLDVKDYDKQLKRWPSIICVIDEFPAFIRQLAEGKGNKDSYTVIEELLNRARKTKVHLILAAQDTTKGGMGITNTNLTAGIAFRCKNWQTSKAIIDETDAVKLTGKGSMYFKCAQGLMRLQGAYMPPEEIMDVLDNIKFFNNNGYDKVKFEINLSPNIENSENNQESLCIEEQDEKILLEIVKNIQDKEKISNNQLKQGLKMGHPRAKRFIDQLEEKGIIGKLEAKKPRTVYSDKAKKFLEDHGYTEGVAYRV